MRAMCPSTLPLGGRDRSVYVCVAPIESKATLCPAKSTDGHEVKCWPQLYSRTKDCRYQQRDKWRIARLSDMSNRGHSSSRFRDNRDETRCGSDLGEVRMDPLGTGNEAGLSNVTMWHSHSKTLAPVLCRLDRDS